MSKFIILSSAQAVALRGLLRTIHGFPRKEEHVIHTRRASGVVYNVTTTEAVQVRKHPTLDLWAIKITRELREMWQAYQAGTLPAPVMARIASLTIVQRDAIRNAIRDAVDLDETWKPASVIAP